MLRTVNNNLVQASRLRVNHLPNKIPAVHGHRSARNHGPCSNQDFSRPSYRRILKLLRKCRLCNQLTNEWFVCFGPRFRVPLLPCLIFISLSFTIRWPSKSDEFRIMNKEKSVVPPTPRYAIGNRGSFFKRPPLENDCTEADGIIFGCPFDAGCSYRVGARFGPQGVRQASQLMQYSYNPFQKAQMSNLKVYDGGDVPCTPYNIQNALESIYNYAGELRKVSSNVICVGGDHTIR